MGPLRAGLIYKAQCIPLKKENGLYGFEAVLDWLPVNKSLDINNINFGWTFF